MKTKLYSVTTLFAFVALVALPNSFAQEVLFQPSVRLVYFLPNDRPARPDRVSALRQLIKDAQQFYADEMQRHGFGRKTFTIETDEGGEPVVHRVNGNSKEEYYYNNSSDHAVWDEISKHFDNNLQHVYFIVIDLSSELLNYGDVCGLGGVSFRPDGGRARFRLRDKTAAEEVIGGFTLIPASGQCFEKLGLTLHELGHSFGVDHDFREGRESDYVMAFGSHKHLSQCAAEWLSVSRFFNTQPVSNNSQGDIQLISTPTYSDEGISIGFEVTDADGLHQAQLLVPEIIQQGSWGPYRLFDCKQLNGETSTVEFISEALTIEPIDRITLQIIDVNGSITWATFLVDIASLLPPPKVVSIPDPNLEKVIRTHLGLTPSDPITDLAMKRIAGIGAVERGITDITGLEYATQLTVLDLGRNRISNYDQLAQLPKLRTLYLWANNIDDLSVLPLMPQLEFLDLNWNQITDISRLAEFTKLTTLSINGNKISDIKPLAGLTNIRNLGLSLNKISDVRPLTGLTKLETLHLEDNPIKNWDLLLAMLRRNPDLKIYLKEGGEPLPVTLSHFRAEQAETDVVIKWTTESELDNAEFNILRSETKNGTFKVVNPTLIQGAGTTSERHTYTWTDTTAKPNIVYYYRIEDISHAAVRKQLATVRMRGYVSAAGKLTTKWGDLKLQE